MALWEYKVITSGTHGFASPTLLEAHLNALGKDEWEIIHFQTQPNNPLAFNGLARRSTTREWTPPEQPVVTAAKTAYEPPPPAAPKSSASAAATDEKPELAPALADADTPAPATAEKTLRTVRDTERDLDPDALDEEEETDWDKFEEDELPTLFDAIKPHLRRNQRGPGMSVGLDYLAKRWEQKETDLIGALKECGFTIPETEEADPDYFEHEGDLYWVNRNNRGLLFLNTREKPRPAFRVTPVNKLSPDDPAAAELVAERAAEKAEIDKRNAERAERQAALNAAAAAKAAAREQAQLAREQAAAAEPSAPSETATPAEGSESSATAAAPADTSAPGTPPPQGAALLERIRPLLRRNRRSPGYSGSSGFLSRALRMTEPEFVAALAALGIVPAATPADKPVSVDIGPFTYWLNQDGRGGLWIHVREKRDGSPRRDSAPKTDAPAPAGTESAESAVATPVAAPDTPSASDVAGVADPGTAPASPEPAVAPSSEAAAPGPANAETVATQETPSGEAGSAETGEPSEDGEEKSEPAKTGKRPARTRAPRGPRKPRAKKE